MAENDAFKDTYKYFRKKNPSPDYSIVLDFDKKHTRSDILKNNNNSLSLLSTNSECAKCMQLGLRSHCTWNVFTIKEKNGFFFITNPFSVDGQRKWINKCLFDYPRKPSVTNLKAQNVDVEEFLSSNDEENANKRSHKLSWATLGYHYDWDAKIYSKYHKSEFPICLQELSEHLANCLGFLNYRPEATIINYYDLKSSLGCHSDYSEEDKTSPILSLSFGQSALFLLGTQNKCDKPSAMFVRSGDIIIMSEACRLAYHAVPCIIPEETSCRYEENGKSDLFKSLQHRRINISVRQVFL